MGCILWYGLCRDRYASYWNTFLCFSFLLDTCPFVGPLIPLFWSSGDVSSGFQSQNGFCLNRTLAEPYVIYISLDSPLVQHLCRCIMPAKRPVSFPTGVFMFILYFICNGLFDWSRDMVLKMIYHCTEWYISWTTDIPPATVVYQLKIRYITLYSRTSVTYSMKLLSNLTAVVYQFLPPGVPLISLMAFQVSGCYNQYTTVYDLTIGTALLGFQILELFCFESLMWTLIRTWWCQQTGKETLL